MDAYLWFLVSVIGVCLVCVAVCAALNRESDRGRADLHERALPVLRDAAASDPRLAALLDEIERGRERGR